MPGLPLLWAIRANTNYLYKEMLHFENWLLQHVLKKTTLGIHIRDNIVSQCELRTIVACSHCHGSHGELIPLVVVRAFYRHNRTFASAVYERFKQDGPSRPVPVGVKRPHVMDVV